MKIFKNRWNKVHIDALKTEEIAQKWGISFAIASIIYTKQLTNSQTEEFLSATFKNKNIKGIAQAAKFVHDHKHSKIMIFGDYDVDGMSATTLLVKFLEANGFSVSYAIPNRYDHGYGLNKKSLSLIPDDVDALITVDCGTTSVEEVKFLKNKGIDVLITDHHEPKDELPKTLLLNPKLGDGFAMHAGAGVALKLCVYLHEHYNYQLNDDAFFYASLGTISDVMPLVDENREIVLRGFQRANVLENEALKKLFDRLSINPLNIQSSDIGFKIGPLLNAAGRMGKEKIAMDFLLEKVDTDSCITSLLELNQLRKSEQKKIEDEVMKKDWSSHSIVIDSSKNWMTGVLGLCASHIAEKYRLPCILLSKEEHTYKGSGRSIGSFDLLKAIDFSSEFLSGYGGHKQAAGVEVPVSSYDKFVQKMQTYTGENLLTSDREKTFSVINLSMQDYHIDMVHELEKLKPYGVGNPKPIFLIENAKLVDVKCFKDTVYKFVFQKADRIIEAILFSKEKLHFFIDDQYDIIGNLEINTFRNQEKLQFVIKDYHNISQLNYFDHPAYFEHQYSLVKSISTYNKKNSVYQYILLENYFEEEHKKIEEVSLKKIENLPSIFLWKDLEKYAEEIEKRIINNIPSRDNLMTIYKYLRVHQIINFSQVKSLFKTLLSLQIFEEIGLIELEINHNLARIQFIETQKKFDLEQSLSFQNARKIKEDFYGFTKKNSGDS